MTAMITSAPPTTGQLRRLLPGASPDMLAALGQLPPRDLSRIIEMLRLDRRIGLSGCNGDPGCPVRYASGPDRPCGEHAGQEDHDAAVARVARDGLLAAPGGDQARAKPV